MCKAWKLQQLWLERAGAVGGGRKVVEQMPGAKTLRKELERVSGTRLIIVHEVVSCLSHALLLESWLTLAIKNTHNQDRFTLPDCFHS